jgi:uncharacterized protein YukE
VLAIARTIRVNTEDLWSASKRYERLANEVEDVSSEMENVRTDLTGAYSRDEFMLRADAISRKSNGIAYSLRDLGGKLIFAASRYDEYDRRVRQGAESVSDDDWD